jgi:ATP-dependent protease ClpP protease subunit
MTEMRSRAASAGLRVMAQAHPAPIAVRRQREVSAFAPPEAFDRWNAGLRAAAVGDNVITVYDVIGEDFWTGGGVTVNRIDAALRKIGPDRDVEVHVNSPGGDMFEGIAIFNRLLQHPGKVTVKVMGLAASAASIIAMAGEEILMGPASFLMIHNCWVMAMGDRHAMAETAGLLAPFDEAMAAVYAARSGRDAAEVSAWMDAETWMTGPVALERGFATGLLEMAEVTEDETARAQARETNAVRVAEINLCRAGATRASARALINQIKGTPGAAPIDPMPGAGVPTWLGDAAALLNTLRS